MNSKILSFRSIMVCLAVLLNSTSAPAQPFNGRSVERRSWNSSQDQQLLKRFDRNGDGWLNTAERKDALSYLGLDSTTLRRSATPDEVHPGVGVTPADVKSFPGRALFDTTVVRTLFLNFDENYWEEELDAFHGSEIDVAATVIVDGKTYRNVGVHFRGNTSYMMVPAGYKRSLNLSFNMADEDQRLMGYRTLELMNSAADQSFLRIVLYNQIAREYIAAPKANFMRVVINGEDWGVYINRQQFNADFVKDAVGAKGARWKLKGRPSAQGGLEYLGDDVDYYKTIYTIKSEDKPESWAALIKLCKVLNETPPDQLETALKPLLDIDGTLRFLALDNTLVNNDGYWVRASDYSLYTDGQGRFHLAPQDVNETLRTLEQFGRRFSHGAGDYASGVALDPLVSANDPTKALLYRLLAVPALKKRYLAYVHDIADKWLDWDRLGPIARQYHELIAPYVKLDTRKLVSTDEFSKSLTQDSGNESFSPIAPSPISLKTFADQRRDYLRKYFELAK